MRPAGIPGKFKCHSVTLATLYWLGIAKLCFVIRGRKNCSWRKEADDQFGRNTHPQTMGLVEVGLSRSTTRRVDNPFRDTERLSYTVLSALDQSQPDNHG